MNLPNKTLFLILLLASVLRFTGIYPGYPPQHPDEAAYSSAIEMIHHNNLDPLRYDYPSGVAVIMLLFFKLIFIPVNWIRVLILNLGHILNGDISIPFSQNAYKLLYEQVYGRWENDVLFWGRYVTALFGVGTVFLTYISGKRFHGKVVGMIAAFMVAVNFREVLNSHIGLPDIYNGFFIVLVFILIDSLIKKPTLKNYLVIGITLAISFSVKYQIFAFPPFVIAHVFIAFKKSHGNFLTFIKSFFSKGLFITVFITLFSMALINPYHLIKFNEFWTTQKAVSSKYAMGISKFNLYSISYYYHFGIGQMISVLVLIGLVMSLVKEKFRTLLMLSTIVPFLFIFLYYSIGGFYTRNFLTIIPLLMIFAAIPLQTVFEYINSRLKRSNTKFTKKLLTVFLILVLIFVTWSNSEKSIIIAKEFSKPWGLEILKDWIVENIPADSKVSAHSNVPLPDNITRLSYDFDNSFSLDEFIEEGNADYAITNFAWATNGFYWWMNVDPKNGFRYWNKPINILEYSYPALTIRELEPFTVFSIFKPWYAPGNDFLVAKIPKINIKEKEKIISFNFDKDPAGWEKIGKFWKNDDNLNWENGMLIVKQAPMSLPSLRWQSPEINVSKWQGFVIESKMKNETNLEKIKGGYIFANFYKTSEDAKNSQNRVGVRISSRIKTPNQIVDKELVGKVPEGAKFMTIGFSSYNPTTSQSYLDELTIYKAKVNYDFSGVKVSPFHIDEGNLYPNSHGNL